MALGELCQDVFPGPRWERFSLIDAIYFRGDGGLTAGADRSWWAQGQPGWWSETF